VRWIRPTTQRRGANGKRAFRRKCSHVNERTSLKCDVTRERGEKEENTQERGSAFQSHFCEYVCQRGVKSSGVNAVSRTHNKVWNRCGSKIANTPTIKREHESTRARENEKTREIELERERTDLFQRFFQRFGKIYLKRYLQSGESM
jgi:hypothetical protein